MGLPILDRTSVSASDALAIRNVSVSEDSKESTITREEFITPTISVNPDTTHAIPIANGVVIATKGSASAFTLAAPSTAENGTRITVISNSAHAHVITATGLIHDGVTGGAKNTATFGAHVGASITLIAYSGKWYVESKNVVTIA